MTDRPTEDPETVKREERIAPGTVAEIQRLGQDTMTIRERSPRPIIRPGTMASFDLWYRHQYWGRLKKWEILEIMERAGIGLSKSSEGGK